MSPRHITGTVAGQHSVRETRELFAAKNYDIDQVQAAFDAFVPTWRQTEPGAVAEWSKDWNAFADRWRTAAVKSAISETYATALAPPFLPDNLVPNEVGWDAALEALSKKSGFISPGDFQDLQNRLAHAQGAAIDFSDQPQPTGASDVDLKVFQASDASLKAIAIDPSADLVPQFGAWILGGIGVVSLLLFAREMRR